MDNDEDIYRIRNNINNGYELENAIDRQKVGNNKTFEQMVDEQLNKQNYNNNNFNNNNNMNNNMNNINNNKNIGSGGIGPKPNIVDVDSQYVGNNKDFAQMVEEQLRAAGNQDIDYQINAEDSLLPKLSKIAEPLIPIISFPIFKLIFSKLWKNNEVGFKQLMDEINNYTNSTLLDNKSPEEIVVATLCSCAFALQNNIIPQSLLAAIETIKVTL